MSLERKALIHETFAVGADRRLESEELLAGLSLLNLQFVLSTAVSATGFDGVGLGSF
jgi:hypothetical protein